MPVGTVTSIYRYPLKGFSPEALAAVALTLGEALPYDRAYAVENGRGRFDASDPRPLPKVNFLMLMRNERLATLTTSFDPETHVLTILRSGKQVARGDLSGKLGRQMIEQFLAAYLKDDLRGPPHIVQAPGHSFTDHPEKRVHIVNLETVRDLERLLGKPVNPLRFRANVYVDGVPAWEELRWLGQVIELGAVRLSVSERTVRCEATNVDPATGVRDLAIPRLIERHFGHQDCGVYAEVLVGGTVQPGDTLKLL